MTLSSEDMGNTSVPLCVSQTKRPQLSGAIVEPSEPYLRERNHPDAVIDLFKANKLVAKCAGEMNRGAAPRSRPRGGNATDFEMSGVLDRRQTRWHRPAGSAVTAGRDAIV